MKFRERQRSSQGAINSNRVVKPRAWKTSTQEIDQNKHLFKILVFKILAGAANRTRTCDPVITNDVLYQLSYCGGPSGASATA